MFYSSLHGDLCWGNCVRYSGQQRREELIVNTGPCNIDHLAYGYLRAHDVSELWCFSVWLPKPCGKVSNAKPLLMSAFIFLGSHTLVDFCCFLSDQFGN